MSDIFRHEDVYLRTGIYSVTEILKVFDKFSEFLGLTPSKSICEIGLNWCSAWPPPHQFKWRNSKNSTNTIKICFRCYIKYDISHKIISINNVLHYLLSLYFKEYVTKCFQFWIELNVQILFVRSTKVLTEQ